MSNIRKAMSNFLGIFDAIGEINEKYKHPRIKMTPMVKISLFALRVYLFFMVAILLYKFIQIAVFNK